LSSSDEQTALNVFTTSQLSFQQLQTNTSADGREVKWLNLFGFFLDNQDISELSWSMCNERSPSDDNDNKFVFSEDSKSLVEWLDCFKINGEWDIGAYGDAVNILVEL